MSSQFIRRQLGFGLSIALLVAVSEFAAAQERFTPHHVAKIRTVTSVAIAPDGRQIAYVLSVPRVPFQEDDGPAWDELHVVRPDRSSRPFVTGSVNVGSIAWTGDGRGIAFLAKRGSDAARSLYVMPADGGEASRVLTHETDIAAFDLSDDGRRVAFVARQSPPKERQELAKKGFNQEIYEETVLPQRVWIADLRDGRAGTPRAIDLPGHASSVSWSPDGSKLIVVHAPTPLVDDDLMSRRVWIVDAASGNVAARIDNPGKLGPIRWSPDGRFIALISGEDQHDPAAGRLMVVPGDGGPLRDVLPGYEGHVGAHYLQGPGGEPPPHQIDYAAPAGTTSTQAVGR